MAWKGIVGKSFTPDGFAAYVAGLKFGVWRPKFVVVHNTSAPDTKTWNYGDSALNSWTGGFGSRLAAVRARGGVLCSMMSRKSIECTVTVIPVIPVTVIPLKDT